MEVNMKSRLPEGYGKGGQPNMQGLMKQAQKMQEDVARVTAEVEEMDFTSSSGGGAVEVVVTGKKQIKSIKIKPEVIDPEDAEMLEDLLIAAVNEALRQAEETSNREIEKVSGGMSLPGMF